MAEYMLDRYHRRREKIIDLLGGECSECGTDENLEIDHIDKTIKEINIARHLSGLAQDKLEKEISKCQLLCGTCHRRKTFDESERYGSYLCDCGAFYEDRMAYMGHKRWCQGD